MQADADFLHGVADRGREDSGDALAFDSDDPRLERVFGRKTERNSDCILLDRSPPRPATPIEFVQSSTSFKSFLINSALAGGMCDRNASAASGFRQRQHKKCLEEGIPVWAWLVLRNGFRMPSEKFISLIMILLKPACKGTKTIHHEFQPSEFQPRRSWRWVGVDKDNHDQS